MGCPRVPPAAPQAWRADTVSPRRACGGFTMTRELLSEAESLLPGGLRPPQREGPGKLQRKWTEALRSTVGDRPAATPFSCVRAGVGWP